MLMDTDVKGHKHPWVKYNMLMLRYVKNWTK